MRKEIAEKILQETELGYDLMSGKFSQTRKHFWRGLEFLKGYAKTGDAVLDFGCGNGRLLELIGDVRDIAYHGLDVSQELIAIAKDNYPQLDRNFSKISGQAALPFADNFFNAVYSIAVFHHFPSADYRREMAEELFRVTRKEGYVIVTVWNLWQRKYVKNILKNWWRKMTGRSGLDWNDCHISFTDNQGRKFQRFHHAFTARELADLFSAAGFSIESCEVIGGRNIVLVGKKRNWYSM